MAEDETSVDVTQEESGTPPGRWDSVTLDLLSVGDRVRVTHLRDEDSVQEAVVTHLHCSMERASNPFDTRRAVQLTKDNDMRFCAHSDTWSFERWVVSSARPAFTWVAVPSSVLAVGDHVRGTSPRGDNVVEGVVESVSGAGYVKLDTSAGRLGRGRRWERRSRVGTTQPVVVEPAPGGWIPATPDILQVGDVVRARPGNIGGLMQARVTGRATIVGRFDAETIDVIEPSSNGRTSDMGRTAGVYYYYRFNEDPAPLVWRGEGPAPSPNREATAPAVSAAATPEAGTWSDVNSLLLTEGDRARWRYDSEDAEWHEVTVTEVDSDGDVYIEGSRDYITGSRSKNWQRWVATPTQADGTPLPDWATSLDAARRHVHAKARELFASRDNCARGTADFLSAAGLPDHRRDYPAPPDETEQIREFLTLVREAAITTANRHGKTMSLVHTWLRREGITEPAPPPVQYTVTVTAPAGTSREDVITSARQLGRQGWEVS